MATQSLPDLVAQYAAGADLPAQGVAGLTTAELNAHPVPGTWSIQQIVLHLMDSDLIASDRMKRIIAEDNPLIAAYNETLFSQRLFYEQMNVAQAVEVFRLNRMLTAELLRRLPLDAFERSGTHTERGRLTLRSLVETYVGHVHHHMKFLDQKRKLLGR